jgi:hypothetical protein
VEGLSRRIHRKVAEMSVFMFLVSADGIHGENGNGSTTARIETEGYQEALRLLSARMLWMYDVRDYRIDRAEVLENSRWKIIQ